MQNLFHHSLSLIFIIDLMGTAAFAVSGVLVAGKKGMDLFGVVVIALVTAIGGGTIRDVLLGRQPVFWMAEPGYLVFITFVALITVAVYQRIKFPFKTLLLVDALGLAFFTIMGAQVAEQFGQHPIVCVVMGMITGVAGGMVRDVLCNEIPLILQRDIYATATLLGAGIYFSLKSLGISGSPAAIIGIIIIFVLRIMAIYFDLKLPIFHLTHDEKDVNMD